MKKPAEDILPRVRTVRAVGAPWTIEVGWTDGTKDRIDLTGLVHRSRHFQTFLGDRAAFRAVGVADFGGGIEWKNGLDYGADTLKVLSEEQRPMRGADLVALESGLGLSTAETAALLGLAERTVRAYRKRKRLPRAVAIAIRAVRESDTVLAAHYRPAGRRARGRPTKKAPFPLPAFRGERGG